MLKEAPFRPRPSTQSGETAGVCLPVSQPCRSTLSFFRSFSSLPHLTHKDSSGWAWLCPPESERSR